MTLEEIWRRSLALVRRDTTTRDLEEEMRLHLALRAERYEESGMRRSGAHAAAPQRFGNVG